MEHSFGLLKPDCIRRNLVPEVMDIIRQSLVIVTAKGRILTERQARIVWAPCVKEPFFPKMLKFQTSGICLVFIVRGEDCINILNKIVGHYNPAVGSGIRQQFGISKMENIIHSSKDEVSFLRESALFFKANEYVGKTPMLVVR